MKTTSLPGLLLGCLTLLVCFTATGQDVTHSSSPEKPVQQQAGNDRTLAPTTDSATQSSTLSASGEAGKSGLLTTANDAGLQPAGVCEVVNDLLASYCADRPDDLSCHFQ